MFRFDWQKQSKTGQEPPAHCPIGNVRGVAIRYKPPRLNHAILLALCRIHGIDRRFVPRQIQW